MTVDTHSRKLRRLFIEPSGFMALFKKGLRIREDFLVAEGVPEDAEIIGIYYDQETHGVVILISSDELGEVAEGSVIPFQQITIRTGEEAIFGPGW